MTNRAILQVKDLVKHFPVHGGFLRKPKSFVRAVNGVSFEVMPGQTFGLVGESGCGKSTLGRTILRLYRPTSGDIIFQGSNIAQLSQRALAPVRQSIQMVFQDPYASLNPRHSIGQILTEPLVVNRVCSRAEAWKRAQDLCSLVGLPHNALNRYAHEFSGGQRQRVGIARAIALRPALIVADEPVSALDVSVQAQVLNLMKDLQDELKLSYLFVSHDLGVIEHMCDTVAVMYLGSIVEMGPVSEVFNNPQHPYTRTLLQAIPTVGEGKRRERRFLSGEVPSPLDAPEGCSFHARCPLATATCRTQTPRLFPVAASALHSAACLRLQGV